MAIRAVAFDLFDTLVDLHMERLPRGRFRGRPVPATVEALHAAVRERAEGLSYEGFLEALSEVDADFLKSHYAQHIELPTVERFDAVLERLGIADPTLSGELTSIHMNRLREHVRTLEHHAEVFGVLEGRVKTAVCSNFSHSETALAVLDEAGLADCFDAIVISDAVGFRKPRPEIFQSLLDELGVAADEVLHVGDNLSADVGGAASLGIKTVWITRRVADTGKALERYDGPAPDFCVSDLAEIPPLLRAEGS